MRCRHDEAGALAAARRRALVSGIDVRVQQTDGDRPRHRSACNVAISASRADSSSGSSTRRWRRAVRGCRTSAPARPAVVDPARGSCKNSRRVCRPIRSTSSNPAVATSATRAPLRSSTALVATVEPCTISSGVPCVASSASPVRIAREGSSGVDRFFVRDESIAGKQHQVSKGAASIHANSHHVSYGLRRLRCQ